MYIRVLLWLLFRWNICILYQILITYFDTDNESVGDSTVNIQATNEEVTGNMIDTGRYLKMRNITIL